MVTATKPQAPTMDQALAELLPHVSSDFLRQFRRYGRELGYRNLARRIVEAASIDVEAEIGEGDSESDQAPADTDESDTSKPVAPAAKRVRSFRERIAGRKLSQAQRTGIPGPNLPTNGRGGLKVIGLGALERDHPIPSGLAERNPDGTRKLHKLADGPAWTSKLVTRAELPTWQREAIERAEKGGAPVLPPESEEAAA